jgi:hypothetical protein
MLKRRTTPHTGGCWWKWGGDVECRSATVFFFSLIRAHIDLMSFDTILMTLKRSLWLHTWRPRRWSRSQMAIAAFNLWEAWSWIWCLHVFPRDHCLHHLPFLPLMHSIVCSVNIFYYFRWIVQRSDTRGYWDGRGGGIHSMSGVENEVTPNVLLSSWSHPHLLTPLKRSCRMHLHKVCYFSLISTWHKILNILFTHCWICAVIAFFSNCK